MTKRLVLCFDGTWNSADSSRSETNVARIARAVRANSGGDGPQLTLYLRGVGSTGIPLQRFVSGAIGEGIDENIRSGYMFLSQNYEPGDAIFLFGFSRGAFTARSLAGFLGACGLLKRQCLGQVTKAWSYYRTATERSPAGFCAATGADCYGAAAVAFLGVWDTVGALGIPGALFSETNAKEYEFHDTAPSRIVKVGRHALAIDEHRDEFVPTLWTGKAPDNCSIQQVWFPGAHSDVGGGYGERGIADITLRWMADEAIAAGLKLDEDMLPPRNGHPLDPLAPQHESRQGWSAKDRFTPTIREVCGREVPVSLLERLYRPLDADGNRLMGINEAVHASATQRYGRSVRLITDVDDNQSEVVEYRPKNLAPIVTGAGG